MDLVLHIFKGQWTNHAAWIVNGAYFSFHPSKSLVADLGSRELPLPAGVAQGQVRAFEPEFRSPDADEALFGAAAETIALEGLKVARAGQMADDFFQLKMPYILWDPGQVGVINCVTSSILILNAALPCDLPVAWNAKWGDIFRRLRVSAVQGGNWAHDAIVRPEPNLMHVHHLAELARDWADEVAQTEVDWVRGALPSPGPLATSPINDDPEI
jgi:hypothetical protein